MSFNPKLVKPEEAPLDLSGELELPDDLLELAAQLRDDATMLAQRYPAPAPQHIEKVVAALPVESPRSTGKTLRRLSLAVGSLATALLIAVAVYQQPHGAPVAPNTPNDRPAAPQPNTVATNNDIAKPAGPRIERLPWAPMPVMGEVSGPELEGLLDLWQNNEHPAETRISL